MSTPDALPQSARKAFAAIGLAQGFTYWLHHLGQPFAEGWSSGCAMAVVVWVSVAGLAAQGAWTGRNPLRLFALCGSLGVPFALSAAWVWADAHRVDRGLGIGRFPFTAFAAFYILLPFLQTFQRSGAARFPYSALFFHSWTNFFIGAMGLLYAMLLAIVLLLWGALFDLIGIEFFSKLFGEEWFVRMTYPTVFGWGIAAGRDGARFADAGRTAALAAFRFLLPLLAFVTFLFLAALVSTGLQPLWDTGHAAALLLALCLALVLFANAAFEDGARDPLLAPWARWVARAALVVLPLVAGVSCYAIWLRVDQYGLSPQRFLGSVFGAIALGYGFAYAFAALRWRTAWLAPLRRSNVVLALAVAATLLLLESPILDPLAWSARSQLDRLLSGRADPKTFDYANLRFQLGQPGLAALASLAQLEEHPELSEIRAGVKSAWELKRYAPPTAASRLLKLELVGEAKALPDGLAESIADEDRLDCRKSRCLVFAVELDRLEREEYCVVVGEREDLVDWWQSACFGQSETGWRRLGNLSPRGDDADVTSDSLLRSPPTSVPAELDDVQIAGHSFAVVR